MIGRMHHVILDAPDPARLADFYSALFGLPITYRDNDFAVVSVDSTTSGIAFQRISNRTPSAWPDDGPLSIHMDVMVDDVDLAADRLTQLGARVLRRADGSCVLADPAGHPFCLIPRPHWAQPVTDSADP
jgi:catechol 2,3-dioxygenase-like lactoylglutathione lyase family enzyme